MRRILLLLTLSLGLLGALPLLVPTGEAQDTSAASGSWLERQLESLIPGLHIEGLAGVFRAAPTARLITLADAQGVWLRMEQVTLNIGITALLRGELRLEQLDAAVMQVERLPESQSTQPSQGGFPQLPHLPVDVSIDHLGVQRLELDPAVAGQAATFSLTGQAALRSSSLQAKLDLQRLDAEGRAQADIALTPSAGQLSAQLTMHEAAGGLMPVLLGLKDHPLSLDLKLAGPATGASLSLQAGLGPDVSLTAQGQVWATPDGAYGVKIDGEARAAPLLPDDYANLASPLDYSLDADFSVQQRLSLHGLSLRTPAGTATASGTADLESKALDLRATLDAIESRPFAPLLPQGVAWNALRLGLRISGTTTAPAIDMEAIPDGLTTGIAQADAVLGPAPHLSLRAALPGPSLDAELVGVDGRLTAQGSLDDPLDVTARLSLPRLAAFGPDSEGALEMVAHAQGSRADPTVTLTAHSDRLGIAGRVLEALNLNALVQTPRSSPHLQANMDGRLDNLPLSLALLGQPEGDMLRLSEGEARLGSARLTLAGLLDPTSKVFDGTARLEATDLAQLGRLAGVQDVAGRLGLQAQLSPAPDGTQFFDIRFDAPRLVYAGNEGNLQAAAKGTPAGFDWTLQGRATEGSLSGRGRAATADGGRRLDLAALEAQAMGESLRLAAPAQVMLGTDGGVRVPGLTLLISEGGRIQAGGRWGPERADLNVTIATLPASLAQRFAPQLEPQGVLSGEIRVTGPTARPDIRATLQGNGLRSGAGWAQSLPALTIRAEGRMAEGAAQLRAELNAGPAGRLTATARLPKGFGTEAPVEAALDGGLDLAPLAGPFLAGGGDRLTGRLAVALRAEGPLGSPRLGGRATLSNGDYRNLVYGARLSNISGVVTGDGTRLVIERLQARTTGGGSMGLRGGVDFGAAGLPMDITLTARNAKPIVSDLATATIGADLRLSGPLMEGATLAGDVRVQQAEIRVPSSLPASVPVLTGVKEVGFPPGTSPPPPSPPASVTPALPPIALALRISAPQQVFVRGRGLDAELGGEIAIGGTLAEPAPSGELRLRRGTLNVLAQQLTFQRGIITFAPITLVPQLDMAAKSTVQQTTITVSVQGPANAPQVTFTSSPELPQDEILAQLLFGRPTSKLSPFEIAQLAQAVGELTGVASGSGAVDWVRSTLGLDRLGLTSNPSGSGPAVEAGRYVAPGVYLGVRQGTTGQTGVEVQVDLTSRLRLQGQTATGPAGDRIGLSYEFEY
ncbi:MAG: translocation/assembly module TamB domain-containing protein [Acetobacteraceae bacterium]|nr:translocation/assembly module TamB domain-containing protein [Acetobacteraceae bacterium]